MILINIVLILLIISSIFNHSPNNALYCGIWGFSGKKGRKADLRKLLILGLYNRTRGTDSCGYYYNGNIVKGIGKESDFKDFIVTNGFKPGDLPTEIVMCHARKSTYGSHTEENAHPHQVGNLVQTHNGTIKNIWKLCTDHGISHTNIHVDSIGLAHIIQKDGFSVLNEYEGYAALTMAYTDDPETLYLYHGASREKEKEPVYEERPLYYLLTNEGLYYSSMEESLTIINTSKTIKPQILPHNIVYKVQHGEIVDKVYKVERDNNNISKVVVYNNTTNWHKNAVDWTNNRQNTAAAVTARQTEMTFHQALKERGMVLKETAPPESTSQDIYFRYGRFHKTDYTQIGDGVNANWEEVEVLLNGAYVIDRKGKFITKGTNTKEVSETYYFIRGVMMKDLHYYKKCLDEKERWADLTCNMGLMLSRYSRYPVTCYFNEGKGLNNGLRNAWYLDQNRYNGQVDVKFTARSYKIKYGLLDTIIRPGDAPEALNIQAEIPEKRTIYVDIADKLIDEADEYYPLYCVIEQWADKVLTEDDILTMPECFLMFIEEYLNESEQIVLSERELFNKVVYQVTEMVQHGLTLLEVFKNAFEKDDFLDVKLVRKYFGNYKPEDLESMPNRYTMQPFEIVTDDDCCPAPFDKQLPAPTVINLEDVQEDNAEQQVLVEQEKTEALKRIKIIQEQLQQLQVTADSLQELDTCDEAQNIACSIYKANKQLLDNINLELSK